MAHSSANAQVEGESQETLVVRLFGLFNISSRGGADLTPLGSKAQGLLALLLTSPGYRRTRLWLQDKLWSDRGPEQGAASLRQALSEIRRALGCNADVLVSDRKTVSLLSGRIEIAPRDEEMEFLEGIDVRDPDFESWLSLERSRTAAAAPPAPIAPSLAPDHSDRPRIVVLLSASRDGDPLRHVEDFFVDGVARTMRELLLADVRTVPLNDPTLSTTEVRIEALRLEGNCFALRVRVEDGASRSLLWSGLQKFTMRGSLPLEDIELMKLGNQLVEAIAETGLGRKISWTDGTQANQLCWIAIRKIFSMTAPQLRAADMLLSEAYAQDPRGVYLAWRAQLKAIQLVERHGYDSSALREEGLKLCADALEQEPCNSMVLATIANGRLIFEENLLASDELSKMSVEINPANPLGWWARSAAKLYGSAHEDAYRLARRARHVAGSSPNRFWWDMQLSHTAAVTRRSEEAITLAERAHALSPEFRPPLRYLIALYAGKGDEAGAVRMADDLSRLEADFSLDRMVRDDSYPVSLMRRNGLLPRDTILDLS